MPTGSEGRCVGIYSAIRSRFFFAAATTAAAAVRVASAVVH